MHPIVKDFIGTSDRLGLILEKYCDNEQFLEATFLKLDRSMNSAVDEKVHLKLELDQAIIKGHSDTSVYLLFISYAIIFLSKRIQLERASVIKSIGASLFQEKFHPLVRAYFIQSVAMLKLFEGNSKECNGLLKESLSLIDKKSPRYYIFLLNLASLKSHQGRLKELDKEELKLLEAPSIDKTQALVCVELKLTHCIFTGNHIEGFKLLEDYKTKFAIKSNYLIEGKTSLLRILSGDFDEGNYHDEFYKLYANACYFLSLGNLEEASKYSKLIQNGNWKSVFRLGFEKYLPLHIELSLKNKGMARLLYQEMEQKVSPYYLDDFFLARLQLLEMNLGGAHESFRRLIDNIKKNEAMKRLVFELQFAKEMKSSDILLLMSNMEDELSIKHRKNKIESDIAPNYKTEKGVKLLIGESSAIVQVKKLVKKFANLKEPILITGETGTGKELVSRAIHDEGPYPKEPFLAINCGALTESLLQSELFGYVAGAFTGAQKERKGIFEAAGKGTVFLDEFGDISQKLQTSLLRVLESNEIRPIGGTNTRQIECKIVVATNIDLKEVVKEKKFREDLYFRLTRFDIKLPPLRERREDISKIINYFLEDKNNPAGKPKIISLGLLEALKAYHWPGNIRELKNEIERIKILHAEKEILNMADFDFTRLQGATTHNNQESDFQELKKIAPKVNTKNRDINDESVLKIVNRGSKIDQRHEFLKELFKKYKRLTRSQIIDIAMISPLTATKDLQILCKTGFIEKCTPTKSVRSHFFILAE